MEMGLLIKRGDKTVQDALSTDDRPGAGRALATLKEAQTADNAKYQAALKAANTKPADAVLDAKAGSPAKASTK